MFYLLGTRFVSMDGLSQEWSGSLVNIGETHMWVKESLKYAKKKI